MDEKTEELRDIFLDVADEETVTETQEETHGSLASDEEIDDRLRSVVETMRERYAFRTSLSTDALVTVVRGFYAGHSDADIARQLPTDASAKAVIRARIDLHLLRDRDLDAPFDLDTLRQLLAADRSTAEIAEELGVSESTVRRYRHIVEVQDEIRAVGERFQDEFEAILHDREIADRMTEDIQEDGLEEATEGLETNVSF
ncbi:MAG: helix-turn-helix domain-containing protein [Halobacteriales archaeon]|nr:helix-turn-helix domain-containing protein [Halobacteriales archaeon]